LDRSKVPIKAKEIKTGNIEPDVVRLGNSVPIYMIQAGSQPVTKIDLIFKAGSWWQSKPLVASTTNAMLMEGTSGYSGEEIAEKIDYYGSYLNPYSDRDHAFISIYSLTKHLDVILPLLSEIIKTPSFPEKELQNYLERRKQAFMVEKNRVTSLAREKFSFALYGRNHPYGQQLTLSDFNNINRDDLEEFHKKFYMSGNFSIIVSGRYNEEDLARKMEDLFGDADWLSGGMIEKVNPKKRASRKMRILIPKEDAVQSALRLGRELFNTTDPEYTGMSVLNNILGGHFGSRLMQNIREKKGYTYGIGSVMVSLRNSGFMVIVSEVGTGYWNAALKEIHKELDKLRSKPVPHSELEFTRSHMLGEVLRGFDGPFAWSESIKSLIEQDLDTGYYQRLSDTILNISPRQLLDLAERYLSPSDMYEIIAGNTGKSG
jgi:zinc protease